MPIRLQRESNLYSEETRGCERFGLITEPPRRCMDHKKTVLNSPHLVWDGCPDFYCDSTGERYVGRATLFDFEYKLLHKVVDLEKGHSDLKLAVQQQQRTIDSLKEEIKSANQTSVEKTGQSVVVLATGITRTDWNNGDKVIFTNASINTDDCYDVSTGIWRVPEAGTYLLLTSFCTYNSKYVGMCFMRDGHNISGPFQVGGRYNDCGTEIIIAFLEKGNRVWVEKREGTVSMPIRHNFQNMFTALLLP